MEQNVVIVFARLPRPGKVKTRLARGLGNDSACIFYKACAENSIAETARCSHAVTRYLFYSDKTEKDGIIHWMRSAGQVDSLLFEPQGEGADVGSRMRDAFRLAFGKGASKAVIVGTDIPDLSAAVIDNALSALDTHDAVFGPAEDGGYYLVGLRSPQDCIFEGIPWSTGDVLKVSLEVAKLAGLDVAPAHRLPVLLDIDTITDLEMWYHNNTTRANDPTPTMLRTVVGDLLRDYSKPRGTGLA